MGFTRKSRKGRRDQDGIDLLTTAFNLDLPNLEREERRRAQNNQQQQHVVVVRRSKQVPHDHDSDSESETAVESEPGTESVESVSEEEVIQCKKKAPKTPQRKLRQRAPSPAPVKCSRKSHRRLHSEPQTRCLKLVEAEAARAPATEPRPSRQEKRREKKLKDKENKKTSRVSTSSEGSPAPRSTPKASAPSLDSGLGTAPWSASAFVQPTMATPMPHHHATYYQPQMAFNQGPYVPEVQDPRFAGSTFAQPHHFASSLYSNAPPHLFDTSRAGLPPFSTTKAQELQRIQRDLDEVTAAINMRPDELSLQAQAAALRNLLNSTLNQAMGQHVLSENMSSGTNKSRDRQKDQKQEKNTQDEPGHLTCDECGSLRSRRYHELHPLAPGKPKHPNLCEGCRETHHKSGFMDEKAQHICFGCGIFRSNAFNKEHLLRPGKPLLVNFCGRCALEKRDADDIVSPTVLHDVKHRGRKVFVNKAEPMVSHSKEIPKTRSKKTVPDALESSIRNALPPRESVTGGGDPDMVSPLSPYSQRRLERRSRKRNSAYDGLDPVTSSKDPAQKYQAPFVEDITTPLPKRATVPKSKLSSILRENVVESISSQGSRNISPLSSGSVKSSGNKSVKFRDYVGVRSLSSSSSGLSSDAKVEEAIKPDDNSIPKYPGYFGESPVRDCFEKPMYTPEGYAAKLRKNASSSGNGYSAPNDGSPDRPWDTPRPPLSTGYSKGAFASMGLDGLGSNTTNLGAKWQGLGKTTGQASWRGPSRNENASSHDRYGQELHHGPTDDFDGMSGKPPPVPSRSQRRSAFASHFNDDAENYQGPIPSSPLCPTSPGPLGQAHQETAHSP